MPTRPKSPTGDPPPTPIPALNQKQVKRFWSYYDIRGIDECWNARGAISKAGYALVGIKGKCYLRHRVAWAIVNGDTTMMVLHSCDNRICGNPNHLHLGDKVMNSHECLSRRRHPRKVSIEQSLEIRKRHAQGESQYSLAAEFGVQQPQISRICTKQRIYGT